MQLLQNMKSIFQSKRKQTEIIIIIIINNNSVQIQCQAHENQTMAGMQSANQINRNSRPVNHRNFAKNLPTKSDEIRFP